MMVREETLDLVLVPLALAALAFYHLWLLYNIVRHPNRTVIGVNAIARKRWVAVMMAVEHREERRAGHPGLAEQHYGVDGAGHDGHHARLRHQRLHRRRVPVVRCADAAGVRDQAGRHFSVVLLLLVRVAAAAFLRQQASRRCVHGQVPGRVALLHAGVRLQRAGHPPVRARQLPPQRPAARQRGGPRGVRGVRGAHGEQRQLRLVARPAGLLRGNGVLPVDVRAHPDARLHRAHVRHALLPRHHPRARPRALARGGARPRPREWYYVAWFDETGWPIFRLR